MKSNPVNPSQSQKDRSQPFVDASRIARVDYRDPDLRPLVSVVVPIYGADHTLAEALASIEVQTMTDLEIVCVNDASPDSSAQIIADHAANDPRYVVVEHTRNCGYGASMNDGISASRGKWIAILEPDDYLLPTMYERLLDAPALFEADADEVDIIKSPYIRELRASGTKRGDEPEKHLNCRYRGRVKPTAQPFTLADPNADHLLRHHPSIWSALYQHAFLAENEIRFHEYPGSGWADNEFFYDTLLHARSVVYLDEPFYVYREETAEEIAAFAHDRKLLRFERWQAMADIIDHLGIAAPSIRAAHVSKGFSYLNEALAVWGEDDPDVQDAAKAMFARMDADLVASEARVAPALKARYFKARGIDYDPARDRFRYYRALAKELLHTYRSNGTAYALDQIKSVIGR